jgi:hypothetical protein
MSKPQSIPLSLGPKGRVQYDLKSIAIGETYRYTGVSPRTICGAVYMHNSRNGTRLIPVVCGKSTVNVVRVR